LDAKLIEREKEIITLQKANEQIKVLTRDKKALETNNNMLFEDKQRLQE